MFLLFATRDSITLTPDELRDEQLNICRRLEAKFLFKFLEKEGLCVFILDYEVLDSTVLHTEGDVQVQVS